MEGSLSYWDKFYSGRQFLSIPSQFATFVLSENFDESLVVIDMGCGNLRDTCFFAQHIRSVVAVDSSLEALSQRNVESYSNIVPVHASIESETLAETLTTHLQNLKTEKLLIFSRFFLHALTDSQQDAHLALCAKLLTRFQGSFAAEYRTKRDEQNVKVTPDHYRRYINPLELCSHAASYGLKCYYHVEGFGFAKYKADDAYVARSLFSLEE